MSQAMPMFQPVRTWSLQEAQEALPEVRGLLADARTVRGALRDVEAQMKDLMIIHGKEVQDGGPGHDEWTGYAAQRRALQVQMQAAIDAFTQRGIEIKDVDIGLVDFFAERGDELVFLCWRDGEGRIEAWHPIETGFSGRQPLPEDLAGA